MAKKAEKVELAFSGDSIVDQELFQKMYECINAAPTFEYDTAKGPALVKRNLEILDILDEGVEEIGGPHWQGDVANKRLTPGPHVYLFSVSQFEVIEKRMINGQYILTPVGQKKYILPMLQRFEEAKRKAGLL